MTNINKPQGMRFRTGPISDRACEAIIRRNREEKQYQKNMKRYKSINLSKIKEQEEIDGGKLLEEQKTKNRKLKFQLQDNKRDSSCVIQKLEKMLKSSIEEKQWNKIKNLQKIKELTLEIQEYKKNQGANIEAEQLPKMNDQLSKKIKQKDQQIAKLKDELSRQRESHSASQIQIKKLEKIIKTKQRQIQQRDQKIKNLNQQLKAGSVVSSPTKSVNASQKSEESNVITKVYNYLFKDSIIDSKVINSENKQKKLLGMFKEYKQPIGFQLLFRASNHDFAAWNEKERYCGVAHTVLLVRTQYGKTIGGYTPLMWKISKEKKGWEYEYDKSGESFVFSISNNHKLALQLPIKNEAISHYNPSGPIFCGSIWIKDKSNTERKSQALYSKPLKYSHPEYNADDKDTWMKFSGSSDEYFHIEEWQVHRVIFPEAH